MSKCGYCGGFSFKLEEASPVGSNFKIYFVQCSICNVPAGTMDYLHTGSLIKGIEQKFASLSNEINRINNNIGAIDHNIRVIANKIK